MGILGDFISGFMEGITEDTNSIRVSPQQNYFPQAVDDQGEMTISSLDQMSKWLNTLQKGASPAVREALSAQISVIRFVQSPTLVDTTFDTLLYSLDKSLRNAKNNEEKAEIREVFCLMIQNYAFFMDAKYQMEVNKNQEEGRRLFIEAGEMLSNSIKDIALLAVGNADVSGIANTTITNLFAPTNNTGGLTGFLNRLFNYFAKEEDLFEQERQFYSTIENIIRKLGEPNTQKLLGKSNLLAGTIQRYVPNLRDFCFNHHTTLYNLNERDNKVFSNWGKVIGFWLTGSVLVALVRYFFSFTFKAPWLGRHVLWTVIVMVGVSLIFYAIHYFIAKDIKKETNTLNEYFDSLFAIGESYKVPYDSQEFSPEEAYNQFSQILEEQGEELAFQFASSVYQEKGFEGFYLPVCEHYLNVETDYSKAINIANEGILAAKRAGNDFTVVGLTYDKAIILAILGRYDQARTCYSYVESHVDPELNNADGNNVKQDCEEQVKRLNELISASTPSSETSLSPRIVSITKDELEYMEIYKEYVADGDISERDRKMLEMLRVRCGISEERARELELSYSEPQLTKNEQEYLEMYKEYAADGEISERDRKMLNRMLDKMGISEERATEIEQLYD